MQGSQELGKSLSHQEFEQAAQELMALTGRPNASMAVALTISLSQAATRYERDLDTNVCRPLGLNLSSYRLLFSLQAMGPLRPGDLSELTGLAPGSITSILQRLEQDGYLERQRNQHNRRETIVTITALGREFIQRTIDASTDRQENWLRALTRGEAIELTRLLHLVIEHDPEN